MKTFHIKYILFYLGMAIAPVSCGIDNFDEPDTSFSGRIVYKEQPIQVRHGEVRFQLWQPGFGNPGPIEVPVNQDGSFSTLLFKGEYKLVFVNNAGPFRTEIVNEAQRDTIYVNLDGKKTLDVSVIPYFTVENAQFSLSGNTVNAGCNIRQVVNGEESRQVERVTLYLNSTAFVSDNDLENYARADADIQDPSVITVSADIPEDNTRSYVFARIGVKISGVESLIFSPVKKLEL